MTPGALSKIDKLIEEAEIALEEREHIGNPSLDKKLAKAGDKKAIKGRADRSQDLKADRGARDEFRKRASNLVLKGKTKKAMKDVKSADKFDYDAKFKNKFPDAVKYRNLNELGDRHK